MMLRLRTATFKELGHITIQELVTWLENRGFSSAAKIAWSASELVSLATEHYIMSEEKWGAVHDVHKRTGSRSPSREAKIIKGGRDFDSIDTNRDGVIDRDEWAVAVKR